MNLVNSGDGQVGLCEAEDHGDSCLDVHVVILNNYLRKHHVASYRALAKRVRKLTVLLSVPMEPDRAWDADWEDLDVHVQRNWMIETKWRHSTGFVEPNFIHVPIDTNAKLKSLAPDIVFSYEMGVRTLLAGWFRRMHPRVPLVMVGNMAERIETERGRLRRGFRWFVRKGVDYFTYNGPSCRRYLQQLAIPDEKMFHLPYCIDRDVVLTGERITPQAATRRLIYCGALSQRKGVLRFSQALKRWSEQRPSESIHFTIAGMGEQADDIAKCETSNLSIEFLGNCDPGELKEEYARADICAFPSLADEWGLVPIEAMASGVPVLGSRFAQSVESVVVEGRNGWMFEADDQASIMGAIERALACTPSQLLAMGVAAKRSVHEINENTTAMRFCEVIQAVLPAENLKRPRSRTSAPETDEVVASGSAGHLAR